jgi:hypothetical protein
MMNVIDIDIKQQMVEGTEKGEIKDPVKGGSKQKQEWELDLMKKVKPLSLLFEMNHHVGLELAPSPSCCKECNYVVKIDKDSQSQEHAKLKEAWLTEQKKNQRECDTEQDVVLCMHTEKI